MGRLRLRTAKRRPGAVLVNPTRRRTATPALRTAGMAWADDPARSRWASSFVATSRIQCRASISLWPRAVAMTSGGPPRRRLRLVIPRASAAGRRAGRRRCARSRTPGRRGGASRPGRPGLPVIIAYSLDNCVGLSRDAGPGVLFISRAIGPPSSYFCCHRKSIARETSNILATTAASFPSLRSCTAQSRSSGVERCPFSAISLIHQVIRLESRNP